jgi:hypothetical protein
MARQKEVLDEGTAPLLETVIAEPALRWLVGGRRTWRSQLEHLLELGERPNIKLQVLPSAGAHMLPSAGAHTGIDGTCTVLSFSPELEGDPGVVYVDTLVEGHYYELPEQITKYRKALAGLRAKATKPDVTPVFIRRIAKEP